MKTYNQHAWNQQRNEGVEEKEEEKEEEEGAVKKQLMEFGETRKIWPNGQKHFRILDICWEGEILSGQKCPAGGAALQLISISAALDIWGGG